VPRRARQAKIAANPGLHRRNRCRCRRAASGREHYNYFRDYDPSTGRYLKSDPIGLAGGANTFAYARSNPLRFNDRLGLYVVGSYVRDTGELTLTDFDTGKTITIDAESGGKPFGDPIPPGQYDILARAGRDGFYRLDKVDAMPFNDVDDLTGRDHFRMHHPGRTIGCIAAKEWEPWGEANDMVRSTQNYDYVPDNFKPWWKVWDEEPRAIVRYGWITVY
jgi:RHS repeat-associated protein